MQIPYEVTPRRDTGLFNAKLGIWLFLASEVMLFGGLFSAYVFLRAGVREGIDIPWPNGTDVHGYSFASGEFGVWIGFLNTLVLIASSVLVVMAWASLKTGNWRKFQLYMWGVLISAGIFMVNKGYEYNQKFKHFGVRLVDGTLVDGYLVHDEEHGHNGERITFNASTIEFALSRSNKERVSTYFLDGRFFEKNPDATITLTKFKAEEKDGKFGFEPDGETEALPFSEVEGKLLEMEKLLKNEAESFVAAERKRIKEEAAATPASERAPGWANELRKKIAGVSPLDRPVVTGTLSAPIEFQLKAKDIINRRYQADSIPLFGGNFLKGELVEDMVDLEVHTLDFQMTRNDQESMAWALLGNEEKAYRDGYHHYHEERYKEFSKWVAKGGQIPNDKLRLWKHIHPYKESGGEDPHHTYPIVSIPRDQIRFMSNHGPAFGPYFAIYFTMTGLHGLHVICGAVVLAYFLFFGKKMYDSGERGREHLANRVEVGGLFWHFVDLVWIFLFPIMYLM